MRLADAPRDQLGVLRPEVDDEDRTWLLHGPTVAVRPGFIDGRGALTTAARLRHTLRVRGERPFIECPACGTGNPSGFRFCGGCGQALERPCPSCGAVMGLGLAFCGACGADLSASVERSGHEPLAPSGEERKVVSVLFADLVSSTELATRLDPEDLRELYGSYFEAMSAIVSSHGGALEKFIGDAVVGVFGAPLTHGDDPERAVRAGLAMLAAMGGLNRQLAPDLGQDLALRVGIHTGEVIAAPGSDQALVTGETTSIAARLQAAAPRAGSW